MQKLKEGGFFAPIKATRRTNVESEADRLVNKRAAKKKYDVKRERVISPGRIEREFGDGYGFMFLGGVGPEPWAYADCLDSIFSGQGVHMAGCDGSFVDLFGVGRKRMPKTLQGKGAGRARLYYHGALLEVMVYLLSKQRWLPNDQIRDRVLTGVLQRAQRNASPEIAREFASALAPFLP